jgi:hypothetical protein
MLVVYADLLGTAASGPGLQGTDPPFAQNAKDGAPSEKNRTLKTEGCGTRACGAPEKAKADQQIRHPNGWHAFGARQLPTLWGFDSRVSLTLWRRVRRRRRGRHRGHRRLVPAGNYRVDDRASGLRGLPRGARSRPGRDPKRPAKPQVSRRGTTLCKPRSGEAGGTT